MINENWLKVALTAMSLGVGLYLIPLALIANPEIIRLESEPLAALIAFVQLAVGLSVVSFGLIGYKTFISKFTAIGLGMVIIFGRLAF